MNAEDFCAWLLRTGLSKRAAARALGVSESYVRAMAVGVRAVPDAIAETCDGIEHAPPAPIIMPQFLPAPTKADLDQRTAALERSVRALQQRVAELGAAFEAAGLPIHQQAIPMTDEEAEEAELKILKAHLLEQMQRAATASPGALTDDEDLEAAKARALASLPPEDEIQRQIRQGMLEQREREKLERAKKQQAEEMATIARRAARSGLPD